MKNKFKIGLRTSISIFIALSIGLILKGYQTSQKQQNMNKIVLQKIQTANKHLSNNYEKYPYPQGNLVYLDKNLNQIHLQDKNKSIENVDKIQYIQGNLCGLPNPDKKLKQNAFDPRFSTGANQKCFTYTISKNQKNYQIGYILQKQGQYIAYLTGNSDKNIIQDYKSNQIVSDQQSNYLPYGPYMQNKIKLVKKYGQADTITIKENGRKLNAQVIQKANMNQKGLKLPKLDSTKNIQINLKGKKFAYKLIYPDGSMQFLSPNQEEQVKVSIKDFNFESNTSQAKIVNEIGKMAYNFVRLDKDTNYEIQDQNQGTMAIRGTKFNLDIDSDLSSIFLSEGKIDYQKPDKDYTINSLDSLGFNKNNKLIDLAKKNSKLEGLYSYSVGMDSLSHDSITYNTTLEKDVDLKKDIARQKPFSQMTGKDQLQTSSIVKLKHLNQTYHVLNFKGAIDSQKLFDYNIKNKSFNLSDKLSNICKSNGYQKAISINQAHKFLEFKEMKDDQNKVTFDINSDLSSHIPKGFIIYFKTKTKSSLDLAYYDPQKDNKTINSIGIQKVYPSQGQGKKGISIICQK